MAARAHLSSFSTINCPSALRGANTKIFLVPLNVLGLSTPHITTQIVVLPFISATQIVPIEIFTTRYSLFFIPGSVTFLSKRHGQMPYAVVPPIVEKHESNKL